MARAPPFAVLVLAVPLLVVLLSALVEILVLGLRLWLRDAGADPDDEVVRRRGERLLERCWYAVGVDRRLDLVSKGARLAGGAAAIVRREKRGDSVSS
jgi:hypothetical protein